MTPSAVAACMAPLLLRPFLAGECESEDEFNNNCYNSAQLLAAPNAANNAQAIVTGLCYAQMLYIGRFLVDNSGSEDSVDDEHKVNSYHDAENEADQESDEDPEHVLSGFEFLDDRLKLNGHAVLVVAEGAGQDMIPRTDEQKQKRDEYGIQCF
ncbi:putative 6-phosphofructokinase [Helianthus debilis subsp. tardiflorus]